ncbi:MAG: glycosyltransferase family 4 protein, partial [Bacteroidales bacterium]|nr:glycosyltransferase family 4 protein [Bacteroidales bacterium]
LIYAPDAAFARKTVLMLSSLKDYKGTREFIQLSQRLSEYKFVLVINDTQENIDKWLADNDFSNVGGHLTIWSRQENVATFYNSESLVLILTDRHKFIETFGLTPLEAMSAGLPVIVPTVGGIAEMVEDDVNGYKIDVQNLNAIEGRIRQIFEDEELYSKLSDNAILYSARYNPEDTLDKIIYILSEMDKADK